MLSPLANCVAAGIGPSAGTLWAETGDLIARSGRFVLAPEVVRLTVAKPEAPRILAAVRAGLRLPHDPCWLEFQPAEVFAGDPTSARHAGFLVWRDGAGDVRTRLVVQKRSDTLPNVVVGQTDGSAFAVLICPCDIVFRPSGPVADPTEPGIPQGHMDALAAMVVHWAWVGLTLVALLTARNAPLRIGEHADVARLNRQRERCGKRTLMTARPVQWNLARHDRRAAGTGGAGHGSGRAEAMAHMVRGHLKVRKSGVFWWSPFVRNVHHADGTSGRDYHVTSSERTRVRTANDGV